MADEDHTASLMTPAKLALAQARPKPISTPAAWLDQMASDAGHTQVDRLAQLAEQLKVQHASRDIAPLAAHLGRLGEALPRLDFSLLQGRGWWARTTGKTRSAGAEFARQFEQIDEVAQGLDERAQAPKNGPEAQGATGELTLVETAVEFHAIDKIIDQGARWLQDMRNQLKERQAAAADLQARQAIDDDTARCEILVARLKVLRAVSAAAAQVHEQSLATAGRRAALAQLLRQALAASLKAWRAQQSSLAAAASEGGSSSLKLDEPMESHRELQLCLKQAIAGCAQLQSQETALQESLAALCMQVDSARSR